jgi:RNA polymerase sigma-70 factor (ECF subfamily)
MSTWITLVARSVSIDALRRRTLDTFSINEAMHVPEPPPETPIGAPEIPPGLLTARQRLVLKLLYEDELDVADAASVLNVTPQTIRSTKHKAMERLRTHFGPEHPGDTPPDEAVQSQENA